MALCLWLFDSGWFIGVHPGLVSGLVTHLVVLAADDVDILYLGW